MEETIADEILPDMSAHLAAAELLPLPDVFSLTEYGLTLHYPIRRFETLSERAHKNCKRFLIAAPIVFALFLALKFIFPVE